MFDLTTFRSTTKEFKGVFFIDQGELLALDDILQAQFRELRKRRAAKIAQEARQEVKDNPFRYRDQATREAHKAARKSIGQRYANQVPKGYVEFEIKGVKERFTSFKEAIASGKLEHTAPRDFDALFSAANETIGITLTSGYLFNGIKITVTPPNLFEGKALVDLEQWAEARRQPNHICWWARNPSLISLIVVMFLLFISSLFGSFNDGERRLIFQKEVYELLKTGINDTNRDKALELLLMNSAGLVPMPSQAAAYNSILWIILLGSVILVCLAWLHPKSVVGIGRGKALLQREKWWIFIVVRVVFVSILFGIPIAAGRKQLIEWLLKLFA